MKNWKLKILVAATLMMLFGGIIWAGGQDEGETADNYPAKPVQLIVPANPGGGTDTGARLLAKYLGPELGTEVVVTNMPGAGGTVAQDYVMDAEADGYTLLYFHEAFVANRVFGLSDTTLENDFVTVGGPYVVDTVCMYSKNYKSWEEIEAAAQKGEVLLGTEVGTSFHILFEAIKDRSGLENLRFVDTGAVTPTLAAIEGDQIDIALVPMGIIRDSVKAGHLHVIAFTSAKERSKFSPDVPTMEELGIDVYMPKFYFAAMPKGTLAERAKKFQDAMSKALSNPELIKEADKLFFAAGYLSPKDLYAMEKINFDIMDTYAEGIRG